MAGPYYEGSFTHSSVASLVGLTTTDKIAFYGVTPVSQQSALVAVSTSAGVTGAVGFTTTQAAAIITAVNSLITVLKNLGLTA